MFQFILFILPFFHASQLFASFANHERPTKTLRTYELLMLRGKAWGRRCLAQLQDEASKASTEVSEALADFGGAMLEKPRAPEPLVEAKGG